MSLTGFFSLSLNGVLLISSFFFDKEKNSIGSINIKRPFPAGLLLMARTIN